MPIHGVDLLIPQAVLAGLGGELRAAAQVLDEMLAARLTQQRRSSDSGARRSSDAGAAPAPAHAPNAALQDAPSKKDVAAAGSAWPAEPPDDHELAADLAEEQYR